jgi:hypothetical protein
MPGGFQTQIYPQPVMAVEGDFASQNPYFVFDAGPGGLVAGAAGCRIGRFAWVSPPLDANGTGSIANTTNLSDTGPVSGFVHRTMSALITAFLADASQIIPSGYPVTLMTGGDFWVRNAGTSEALVGQKAYANFADGSVVFAATGSPTVGATGTGAIITQTATITASIAGNLLTVSGSGTQPIVVGSTISGTGIPSSVKVLAQVSGPVGGAGTYALNTAELNIGSESMTVTYGVLTISTQISGFWVVGAVVTGSGVSSGTRITQLGTGAGGAGTYFVDPGQGSGSGPVQATTNVETKWIAMSEGLAGELVKISDHALG